MQPDELLTVLLPTRNRPHNISGQLRLFAKHNLKVIVADSSDPDSAEAIRTTSKDSAQFLSYSPETTFFDKLADAISQIKSPFVLLASDRKITFPHAVESALRFLQEHEDYVSAQGYVVGFDIHGSDFDINRIVFFTPSIEESDPLWRHYHLMRRYQSRQFSLFRLQPLISAISKARMVDGVMFREIMFMNALVLQGKVARLPNIFTLQFIEKSFSPLREIDPLYWFAHDSHSFFQHYARYRSSLAKFIVDNNMANHTRHDLNHLLDTIHSVWLKFNFDSGIMNFATQQLLDGKTLNLPPPQSPLPWQRIRRKDVVHYRRGKGRYIWRTNVLNAEPRSEIHISSGEIKHVESQLDLVYGN
jgi:glycosyltransferase domain-containing protein